MRGNIRCSADKKTEGRDSMKGNAVPLLYINNKCRCINIC